ncbi:MAG: ribosome maturation factor RimM [Gemmatimonadaceae bacterium]
MSELVIVGRVRRAHGVRGALAVESLIDSPDAIFVSGGVVYAGDRAGKESREGALHIVDGRPMNNDWLVQVAEIDDRDVAANWRGRYLLADASLLSEDDESVTSLLAYVGYQVEMDGRGVMGTVRDVYSAPQGPLLEVQTDNGMPLVPWRQEIVRNVDDEKKLVQLYALDGLLDG